MKGLVGREQRVVGAAKLEVRAKDGETPVISGYAAVFNQPSEVISDFFGGFRELVAPGAFTKTLADGADVRALLNHDPNFVLGRTKAGTLSLREDEHGLWMTITPPETQWARDLMATMRRGDLDQSSFGFQTIRDRWGTGKGDGDNLIDERTLLEVRLFDVSPVTFPAYPQTEAGVRSLLGGAGIDADAIARVVGRRQRGMDPAAVDLAVVRSAMDYLGTLLAGGPADTGHPDGGSGTRDGREPAPAGHSIDLMLRALELVATDR